MVKTVSLATFASLFLCHVAMAARATPSAASVIAAAESQAAAGHKNVLVMFHASWCGWCHKLDEFLAKPEIAPLMSANYVTVHIVVEESGDKKVLDNPGGEALLEKLGGKGQGSPYYAMLSPTNETLAISKNDKGQNIAYPEGDAEIPVFIKMLRTTSPHLTDADASLLETKLHEAGKKLEAESELREKLIRPIEDALRKRDYKEVLTESEATISSYPEEAAFPNELRYTALLHLNESKAYSELGQPLGTLAPKDADGERAEIIIEQGSLSERTYRAALLILLARIPKTDVQWSSYSKVGQAYFRLHNMKMAMRYQDKAIETVRAAKLPTAFIDDLLKTEEDWKARR